MSTKWLTVSDLIRELQAMEAAGHGNLNVFLDSGATYEAGSVGLCQGMLYIHDTNHKETPEVPAVKGELLYEIDAQGRKWNAQGEELKTPPSALPLKSYEGSLTGPWPDFLPKKEP